MHIFFIADNCIEWEKLIYVCAYFFLADDCIEWDNWVNEGHISLTSGGDYEPITAVQAASLMCTNPIMIQCARASDELPYDKTGQVVKCSLWDGFMCNNTDNPPLCYDYKVRLGCLKTTPECGRLSLHRFRQTKFFSVKL